MTRSRNVPPRSWQPWKHQLQSLRRYAQTPESILDLSDPGTGKTGVAVEAFAARATNKAALVVAPKTLVYSAWLAEIARIHPELTAVSCLAKNGRTGFDLRADLYITNTDAATWLAEQSASFFRRFDTLIIDESNAFKNRTSQRSKAMAKITRHFEYRAGLTGTPCPISVTELWHQTLLLDDGRRLGTNFWRFQNTCCEAVQIGPRREHIKWVDKPGAHEAVASLLADITIRHRFEDCLDIPPNRIRYVPFVLSTKLRKAYDVLRHDALLVLERGDVTAVHAAALRQKLLQVASGAVYTNPEHEHDLAFGANVVADKGSPWQVIDHARYELIADLIEEREHSVVFFLWRHQRQELVRELEKRKVTHDVIDGATPTSRRRAIVESFQAGELQSLLMHPATGAHGLTLTRGTATIWCSPVSQPDVFKQGNHRIYRGGQTQPTETICVHAEETIEKGVYETREVRGDAQSNLLGLLQT